MSCGADASDYRLIPLARRQQAVECSHSVQHGAVQHGRRGNHQAVRVLPQTHRVHRRPGGAVCQLRHRHPGRLQDRQLPHPPVGGRAPGPAVHAGPQQADVSVSEQAAARPQASGPAQMLAGKQCMQAWAPSHCRTGWGRMSISRARMRCGQLGPRAPAPPACWLAWQPVASELAASIHTH